jgi:hypothetical protein
MGNLSEKSFLNWIADRLVNVYGESENVDFINRLREIGDDYEKLQYENMILEEQLASSEEQLQLSDKE